MRIIWDSNKNILNIKKHKISFDEAQTVFYDATTMIAKDPDHSDSEDRFIAIGHSFFNRLLLVIHCYKDDDKVIRIISARKTTRSERKQFEEGL